jgi:hypothetical protein
METHPNQPSDGPTAGAEVPPSPLEPLLHNLDELREFVGHYLAVQSDRVRASVRRAVLLAIAAVVAGIVGVVALAKATLLVLDGAAAAAAALWGGRGWAGQLTVGGFVLLLAFVGLWIATRRINFAAFQRSVARYVHRERHQRATVGQGAAERAAAH